MRHFFGRRRVPPILTIIGDNTSMDSIILSLCKNHSMVKKSGATCLVHPNLMKSVHYYQVLCDKRLNYKLT